MKAFLKKNGIRVGIIILSLLFVIFIASAAGSGKIAMLQNATGALEAPVKKILSSTVNWFDTIYGYLFEYDRLLAENESLRSQLADAQQSARNGSSDAKENERLESLTELRADHKDFVLESSKVVLWSSSNWSSSFTISKGTECGIRVGAPVINESGCVVGQITEVGTAWATVSTILDVDMSVGALVPSSETTGMVIGEYSFMKNKEAKLTYMSDGAQIFVGDKVVTSGAGGAFPTGLLIGELTAVRTESGGQLEYGVIKPACDLDSLVQVFIIKAFSK